MAKLPPFLALLRRVSSEEVRAAQEAGEGGHEVPILGVDVDLAEYYEWTWEDWVWGAVEDREGQ